MPKNDSVEGILGAVNKPLGFFVLALLIAEGFLATVLILASGLSQEQRFTGMLLGVGLVVLVLIAVGLLVWSKPTNLMYGEAAYLKREKIYGTSDKPKTALEIRSEKAEAGK
jgi:hypothetical protein